MDNDKKRSKPPPGRHSTIKISFGSWALALGPYAEDPVPLERVAARLGEAEYDGIELCGSSPHATLEAFPDGGARKRLTRVLQDHGLGISGYAADFSAVNPVIAANRQSYIDLFQRYVEFCAEIGSPSVRVDSVARLSSLAEWEHYSVVDRLAGVWAQAAEIAACSGVRLVWEFEPRFVCSKPSEILALHRKVDHPNFQILFDTADAYMTAAVGTHHHTNRETLHGGVPEFLKRLEGRVGAIHLMDSDGTLEANGASTHRPFGDGCIDFRTLAPQLLDVPEVEWWCIDLSFWPGAGSQIDESRDFVLDLLNAKVAA